MELNREDAGEMYLPDKQREYVPKAGTQNFSIQDLLDDLTSLESEVTVVQSPAKEYALLLEVTMADRPRCPRPAAFSWNAGMVLHILKGDPMLWDLEYVQVDGPGTTYSFMTSRATEDLSRMSLRTSKPMWQKHSPSGFPSLLISKSSSSCWRRPWPHRIGSARDPCVPHDV